MELYWEGKDITGYVIVTKCVHRDVSHGRSDSLEIEFARAASWHRWGPETDDRIHVILDGYDTGAMYLNTILPEGDRYRIVATSLPTAANRKAWDTYRNFTLESVLNRCATECGMGAKLYGIEGGYRYPFLMRQNESCAAFLDRLGVWEGMAIKAVNGAFRGIGIEYAQKRNPILTLNITPDTTGTQYIRRKNEKRSAITVRTPYAEATARDSAAEGGYQIIKSEIPAMDAATAGRWARGLLLHCNRTAETFRMGMKFNPHMTAMARVDITGGTDADGEWIVDEALHDLKNGSTEIKLFKCITTIR